MIPDEKRNMAIFAERQSGMSVREIASKYSLCRQRVYQIHAKIERQLASKEHRDRRFIELSEDAPDLGQFLTELEAIASRIDEIISHLSAHDRASEVMIDDLEITVRCYNVLARDMGLKSVADLIEYSDYDLLRQPNFGRKSLNEIVEVLRGFGLSLSKVSKSSRDDARDMGADL